MRSASRFAGTLGSLLVAATVWSTGASAGDETPPEILDEIRVTARQSETVVQEAPIAVSVMSGEDFERAYIVKLDNFTGYVPSLVVAKNDGAGRVVAIRGVGWETAQNLATQPGVLTYVDGVYLANPLALGLSLLDEVERIEVFRGPQGTEFGQSATGGAINIVTRPPDFSAAGGSVLLRVGDPTLLDLGVAANVPLAERLALRVSGHRLDRDGYAEIRGGALDGFELDAADVASGNLSLEWITTPDLSIRASAFLQSSDQGGAAQKNLEDPNTDPRELTQDYPSTFALDDESYSLVVDWSLAPGTVLHSLTGLQRLRKEQTVDGDRLTEDLVAIDLTGFGPANFDLLPYWDNDSDAFSQELRLTRSGPRSQWSSGLYYLEHDNRNAFLEAIGPAPASQFAEQLANPSPETLPPFVPPLEFVEDRTVSRRDGAVYGQLTHRLSDAWSLTAGARLQHDRSRDRTTQFWFNESDQVTEDTAFTWKLGADFDLAPDHLLYLLVSTGWKNGGNNPGALTNGALDVPVSFQPEQLTSYEIGSRNRLAGGRASLNATAFFYDYEDYQYIQEDPVPFAAGTGNIPQVEVWGLETELSWLISDSLQLAGHLTALDGEIISDVVTLDVVDFRRSGFGRFTPTAVADRAGLRESLAGNEPPKLPDLTVRLLLTHTHELATGSQLLSSLDFVYRGDYQYRVFNDPVTDTVPAYATMSLFFGFRPADLPFEVSLQAVNLLDEDGVNARFTNPFGLHTTSDELIPPRSLVASVEWEF